MDAGPGIKRAFEQVESNFSHSAGSLIAISRASGYHQGCLTSSAQVARLRVRNQELQEQVAKLTKELAAARETSGPPRSAPGPETLGPASNIQPTQSGRPVPPQESGATESIPAAAFKELLKDHRSALISLTARTLSDRSDFEGLYTAVEVLDLKTGILLGNAGQEQGLRSGISDLLAHQGFQSQATAFALRTRGEGGPITHTSPRTGGRPGSSRQTLSMDRPISARDKQMEEDLSLPPPLKSDGEVEMDDRSLPAAGGQVSAEPPGNPRDSSLGGVGGAGEW